jgi:hypothetical protein
MSETQRDDILRKRVIYRAPGMDAVRIRRDVEYQAGETGSLTMDLYCPPDSEGSAQIPAVIILAGYAGPFKAIGWTLSWGELLAASGLVAITYATREPVGDARALLEYVRRNSASLGIDPQRIGLLANSGNVPHMLSLLMEKERDYLKAAICFYGYTLDLDGSTTVADAAKTYGFVNPCAGKSVEDLPQNMPMLVVRAGRDQNTGLNEAMDRLVVKALARNLPMTLVNHASGVHAFDLFEDSVQSRAVIRQMLTFMTVELRNEN